MRQCQFASCVMLTFLLTTAATGAAQDQAKGEVAASYTVLHDAYLSDWLPFGWLVSAAGHLNGWASLVGEGAANYHTFGRVRGNVVTEGSNPRMPPSTPWPVASDSAATRTPRSRPSCNCWRVGPTTRRHSSAIQPAASTTGSRNPAPASTS